MVQQLGAGVDALGVGHEEVQQAVFGRADRHRLVVGEHAMRGAVDADRADRHAAVLVVLAGAAHDRTDAGQQFARRERLDHVIVYTGLEAADAVVFLATGGQHDDRHFAGQGFLAPAAGQVQAAGAGQHPVQQDQIGNPVGDRGLGLTGIAGVDRFVIALAKGEGDHFTDRGLVIDDQDAFLHEDTVGLGYWSGASRLRFDDMFVTTGPEPAWIAIDRSCSAQRRSRSGSCTPWRRSSSTVGVIASMRASTRARPT